MGGAVPLLLLATSFAADKHRDQRRKGEHATPYVDHCIRPAHRAYVRPGSGSRSAHGASLWHADLRLWGTKGRREATGNGQALQAAYGPKGG
jgi:hypothetical protein